MGTASQLSKHPLLTIVSIVFTIVFLGTWFVFTSVFCLFGTDLSHGMGLIAHRVNLSVHFLGHSSSAFLAKIFRNDWASLLNSRTTQPLYRMFFRFFVFGTWFVFSDFLFLVQTQAIAHRVKCVFFHEVR